MTAAATLFALGVLAAAGSPIRAPSVPGQAVADATLDPGHYAARVRRGAALLDEAAPGWQARVDPATLDMLAPDRDILAQVFGGFRPFPAGASLDEAASRGFGLSSAEWVVLDREARPWPIDARFLALTVAWRLEIARRREVAP